MHNANSHNSHVTPYVYPFARVSNTRVRDARDVTRVRVTRVTGVVLCDVKRADDACEVTRVMRVRREGEPISACDVKRAERIDVYA